MDSVGEPGGTDGAKPQRSPEEIKQAQKRFNLGCGGLILATIVVVTLVSFLTSDGGDVRDDEDAIVYCHQFVEERLTSPSSADFPSFGEHQVSSLGENQWRVSAYVDADNAFGATLREDWTCEISYDSGDESWNLTSLAGL